MHFSGSYVALVTPWNKDLSGIDFGALKELIEWHIASGTNGMVPAGTTGESATLTHSEHHELIAKTVEFVAGRCTVLAGADSNSTAESISLAKHAEKAGADAILVITPYYNRPTQEGLYRHFGTVAEACSLPMVVYNVPARTGTNILPETIVRISTAYPAVSAVKEASGFMDQASQVIARSTMEVLSGDDSLTLPIMAIGGKGGVSVVANLAPAEMAQMCAAALSGDYLKAREMHYRLLPLMKACFIETNPAPVKTALAMLGKAPGGMRLPMVALKHESRVALEEALRMSGLI